MQFRSTAMSLIMILYEDLCHVFVLMQNSLDFLISVSFSKKILTARNAHKRLQPFFQLVQHFNFAVSCIVGSSLTASRDSVDFPLSRRFRFVVSYIACGHESFVSSQSKRLYELLRPVISWPRSSHLHETVQLDLFNGLKSNFSSHSNVSQNTSSSECSFHRIAIGLLLISATDYILECFIK
jgi:hypothetical protein